MGLLLFLLLCLICVFTCNHKSTATLIINLISAQCTMWRLNLSLALWSVCWKCYLSWTVITCITEAVWQSTKWLWGNVVICWCTQKSLWHLEKSQRSEKQQLSRINSYSSKTKHRQKKGVGNLHKLQTRQHLVGFSPVEVVSYAPTTNAKKREKTKGYNLHHYLLRAQNVPYIWTDINKTFNSGGDDDDGDHIISLNLPPICTS